MGVSKKLAIEAGKEVEERCRREGKEAAADWIRGQYPDVKDGTASWRSAEKEYYKLQEQAATRKQKVDESCLTAKEKECWGSDPEVVAFYRGGSSHD
ncbi:hypothetical protein [Mariprofundus sp. KV]|uniref:hypothetical protein n=1 Tax=Mariprofundus sp. KV TaxID=2608715 RepID=UPI00159FF787|nr:hypothetical protein [Mariprofundus sp. KV]NWF36175.1 hypothetical protein [Mariprofundus sp. KV]